MNEIRFITPDYRTLFTVPDGGEVIIEHKDGYIGHGECKYMDPTHFSLNGQCWHICQFAERMRNIGATARPVKEGEE